MQRNLWESGFRSASGSVFFARAHVCHAIYAAPMSPIPDTAAQLQHIESQLAAVRSLVDARQALIVHVACCKSRQCSSYLQCLFSSSCCSGGFHVFSGVCEAFCMGLGLFLA